MSLREITYDLHREAETSSMARTLLRGEATKEQYAKYLYNLLAVYSPIEFSAKRQGFLKNLSGIERLGKLYEDFLEVDSGAHYELVPSVVEYHDYLVKLSNDPYRRHLIKAHMYVRHMGDLNGGQTIKKQVANISSGKFYEFDNADALKVAIRSELTDDLGPEARVAFIYSIRMMKELSGE